MKSKYSKFGLFFTIISNICIIICFVVGLIVLLDTNLPKKIRKKEFISYIKSKGCKINDIKNDNNYSGVDIDLITDKETCPYLIEYITFNDKDTRNSYLNSGIREIKKNYNITSNTYVTVNLSEEYYKYTTNGRYYKTIVYTDDSILYAAADSKYKNEIMNIYKDFNYDYKINVNGILILSLDFYIFIIICIICMWQIEKKIRNKGWIALIPFYNIGCISKDILGSPWFALLLLFPITNVIFIFLFYYTMGKVFHKSNLYSIFMIFIPSILWPLLAFDNSEYDSNKVLKKAND